MASRTRCDKMPIVTIRKIIFNFNLCLPSSLILVFVVSNAKIKNINGINIECANVLWIDENENPKKFKIQKTATSKSGMIPAMPNIKI